MQQTQVNQKVNLFIKIKEKRLLISIIFLVIVCLIYVFYPRNLGRLILDSNYKVENITILIAATDTREQKEIVLTKEESEIIIHSLQKSYARKQILPKESTSEKNFMGYYIFINDSNNPNSDSVYLFTTELISINGKQYKIYGTSLASEIQNIIGF